MKQLWRIVPHFRVRGIRRRRAASVRSQAHYRRHKKAARILVQSRLLEFSGHYGVKFGKVSIRNQRTRWGSCSKRGNLNFNYRLLFLPPALVDYVIVHELCHLLEFNHSARFWEHVARFAPEYRAYRKELRGRSPLGISK